MTPAPQEPRHRGARYWRVPVRRRGWLAVLAWTLWTVVGLAAAAFAGGYIYLDDTLEAAAPDTAGAREARKATRPVLPGQPVNVLLIGADTRAGEDEPGRSDTLILVRMDSRRGFISMLSFPRDLYVEIPGIGSDKINGAYQHGIAKVIQTVEHLTGEPVNEYVSVDFEGFERLVDVVGGVFIDVDRRYFNDNTHGGPSYAEIDLEPGLQRLSGSDALDYVRYRHTDSDFARIARQQQFLSELKRQTKQLGNLTRFGEFRRIFGDDIEMSIDDVPRFVSLLELALTTEKDRIARNRIEGVDSTAPSGAYILVADPEEVREKVALWKDPDFADEERERPADPATVRVNVLNGSGRLLAAEELAALLREKGYDAHSGGNADAFDYAESAVFYADELRASGKAVQRLLGPGATSAPLDPRSATGNDLVVVVGASFTGALAPPPKPEPRPPADTVDTTSLVEPLRRVERATGLEVLVPMKVATGSRVRIVRAYRIDAPGKPWAVRIVFEVGGQKYWGMGMTSMKNPPIVEGWTGKIPSGGREYLTYYDGRDLQRLVWRRGGLTYWISNTLDYELTANTVQEIAKSTRPLGRARLAKGRTDTQIEVETEGTTP